MVLDVVPLVVVRVMLVFLVVAVVLVSSFGVYMVRGPSFFGPQDGRSFATDRNRAGTLGDKESSSHLLNMLRIERCPVCLGGSSFFCRFQCR